MKNIKQFCKEHKTLLIGGGLIIGGTIISLLALKKTLKLNEAFADLAGQNVISWKPPTNCTTLERVNEVLELNKNNNSCFAIFREGPNPLDYAVILMSDDVLLPKLKV